MMNMNWTINCKTFPPKPKEEIKLDIEATKEALREIFLKEENQKEPHHWFPYQHDFLNEILPAEKDSFGNTSNRRRKSILFQAPALYRGSISGRLTIVVTPLKALMEDHVNKSGELNFLEVLIALTETEKTHNTFTEELQEEIACLLVPIR